MAMRYEWGFDVALLGGLSVHVSDGTTSGTITISSGTYAHTSMASVLGSGQYDDIATKLQTDIRALGGNFNAAVVEWSSPNYSLYALDLEANVTLDFRTVTVGAGGPKLAAVLGINYLNANASGGSADSPYEITFTDGLSEPTYVSNCRPYYLLLPTIEGRSQMTDEYEPEGAVMEAEADDGTAYYSAKDGVSVWSDWLQVAETDTPPAAAASAGSAVFKRSATAEVPWSYQHAWEHLRTGGSLPFLCVDGSDSTVHQMRADGTSFHPTRFASPDYPLWTIPFKTRQLGRL